MVYANWKQELEAFEAECDRIRQSRRASFPIKLMGLAPLATVPFIAKMPLGRQILAGAGIVISGISLMSELDRQREAYGGSLKLDLTPNSDWDNLSGAFETRSPRWCALCFLYAQLDPLHLKDRLGHLPDDEAKRVLDRCIKRVQKGLREIAQLNPNKPTYREQIQALTDDWRGDVSRTLDHALFVAGAIDADDLDPEDFDIEEGEEGDQAEAIASPLPAVGATISTPDAIQPPAISARWSQQQWQLWERIVQDAPDLRFLLLANVVVISGSQQTGKSSLASAIAYCRRYLMGGESVAASPHPDAKTIFDGRVIGFGGNFDAIQGFYDEMVANFKMGDRTRSLIVDELTQYTGDWQKLGQSLVRTAISESTKHGWKPILINHARTVSAGFAGIVGIKELIENSAVQVLRSYAYGADGSQGIDPVIIVTIPGLGERRLSIPAWLWLPTLKQEFPQLLDGWMDGSGGGQNGAISAQNGTVDPSIQQSIQPVGKPVESDIQQSNRPSNNIQQPTPIHPTSPPNPTVHPTASNNHQQPRSDVSPIDWDGLWKDISSKGTQSPNTPNSGDGSLTPKAGQLLEWVKRRSGAATIREAIQHRGFGDRAAIDELVQELENKGLIVYDLGQQKITAR